MNLSRSVRLPQKSKGFAYVGFATEADRKKAIAAKNRSFIEGHQGGSSTAQKSLDFLILGKDILEKS